MALPEFLRIGAQKGGTGWLSRQLRNHPNVWVPPFKELHYFDWQKPWTFVDYRSVAKYRFDTHVERRRLRRMPARVASATRTGRRWDTVWYLRYYVGRPGDRWYARLFSSKQDGQARGELTPDYYVLPEDRIRFVRTLMPVLRILLMLRDPVERSWSHARMFRGKYGSHDVGNLPDEHLIEFVDSRSVRKRSAYTAVLDACLSVFPPEQLMLIWYEEIRSGTSH